MEDSVSLVLHSIAFHVTNERLGLLHIYSHSCLVNLDRQFRARVIMGNISSSFVAILVTGKCARLYHVTLLAK